MTSPHPNAPHRKASPQDDLATISELASVAHRASNRAWLALMAVGLLVLIPRTGETVKLPFDLGDVSRQAFSGVALTMLVAFTLAFAVAHAQAFRAHRLAMTVLETLEQDRVESVLHPHDVFDLVQYPSINRVGPLPQLLRGKYTFFPAAFDTPRWLRWLTRVYYIALRAVAFFFYFVIPSLALWQAFQGAQLSGAWRWPTMVGVTVAALALAQVMVTEIVNTFAVAVRDLGASKNTS